MGALTGNAVKDTYLDLVQLGQSGAGLPAHAGKEAALYDGSGAQILGRTAVRHWLDPHPSAVATTWDFASTPTMTQAALETAGWTFSDCTASVAGGTMKIVSGAGANPWVKAYYSQTLSGDFDIVAAFNRTDAGETQSRTDKWSQGGLVVADTVGDVCYQCYPGFAADRSYCSVEKGGKWSDGSGHTSANTSYFIPATCARIWRISGTIYFATSADWPISSLSFVAAPDSWRVATTAADARTFNVVAITNYPAVSASNASSATISVRSIRRFQ